jgi:hypothetical protein
MASSDIVILKGGVVADVAVVVKLLDIERRGATFQLLEAGRFHVVLANVLSAEDAAFLRQHQDQARKLLEYDVDAVKEPA